MQLSVERKYFVLLINYKKVEQSTWSDPVFRGAARLLRPGKKRSERKMADVIF